MGDGTHGHTVDTRHQLLVLSLGMQLVLPILPGMCSLPPAQSDKALHLRSLDLGR